MFWYSGLLEKEFIDYFKNEDSIYFQVNGKGKIYNETYIKFYNTVQRLLTFSNYDNDIYHSMLRNMFDCDIDSHSTDQLAVGLMLYDKSLKSDKRQKKTQNCFERFD